MKRKRRLSHRRTAGRGQNAFFSLPEQLQKAIGEKTKRQMMVEAAPGAPFKMIEPQLLFELLITLLDLPPLMGPVEHRPHGRATRRTTQIILVPRDTASLSKPGGGRTTHAIPVKNSPNFVATPGSVLEPSP